MTKPEATPARRLERVEATRSTPAIAVSAPRMPVLRHSRPPSQLDLFGSLATRR